MIEILNQQKRHKVNLKVFRGILEKLADYYRLKDPEITLAFVNNPTIERLNQQYRNKKGPTDVLSFPIDEKGADGLPEHAETFFQLADNLIFQLFILIYG